MGATTIKVEGQLLDDLYRAKPAHLSLTAFVRSILERAVLRARLADATERYATLLNESPEEQAWSGQWERADLASPPRKSRRR